MGSLEALRLGVWLNGAIYRPKFRLTLVHIITAFPTMDYFKSQHE